MNLTTSIIGIVAYLILAPIAGGLLAGIDRRISARMQEDMALRFFSRFMTFLNY